MKMTKRQEYYYKLLLKTPVDDLPEEVWKFGLESTREFDDIPDGYFIKFHHVNGIRKYVLSLTDDEIGSVPERKGIFAWLKGLVK